MTTKWTIEFTEDGLKDFGRLDYAIRRRVSEFLGRLRLEEGTPTDQAKPLRGKYKGMWRYRVGDWRVICKPQTSIRIIYVMQIGHRSEIYD